MARTLFLLLPLLIGAPAAAVDEARVTSVVIRERLVIRVPQVPSPATVAVGRVTPAKPTNWREKKGPTCIPAQAMAGWIVTSPRQVDLVLAGGRRVRAKLERACRPLDFYRGFYLRPAADGMICADRDAIKTRSGASCGIDEFKALVAGK